MHVNGERRGSGAHKLIRRLSRHIAFMERELSELDGDIGQAI
jgi:hypothetical protein